MVSPYREDGTGENARSEEADDHLDGDLELHAADDRLMMVVVVAQGLDQMVQQRQVAVDATNLQESQKAVSVTAFQSDYLRV